MNHCNTGLQKRLPGMFGAALAFASVILPVWPAVAQDYPTKEIHAICAYAAGSGADILARFYSDKLSKLSGRPVIVENKAGAQGIIGTEYASRAQPDGYTILITPASANLAAAPHLFKKLPYDPIKDFTAVAPISWLPFIIAVDGKSPIKTVAELVAQLKKKGDKGSYGIGNNTGQVSGALFKEMAGLQTVMITYKTSAQAVTDMSSGQLDFMIWDSTYLSGMGRAGRVRLLALTSASRSGPLPDVPTMAESGFPGFDLSAWWGVVVPAGTPKPIIDRLAGWIGQINDAEETRKFLHNVATDVLKGTPESMAVRIREDTEKWGRYVKVAKIVPE